MSARLQGPSGAHLMGTDPLGRDVFSRLLVGGTLSIRSVAVILVSAVSLGPYRGRDRRVRRRFRRRRRHAGHRSLPGLPGPRPGPGDRRALGPSLTNAMLAVSVVWWPWYARLVRGQVLSIKEEPYVEAARSVGASHPWIVGRHIVPNLLSPVIVQATLDIGSALVVTASLSFIGMGAQPPSPEWGAMLSDGRSFFLNAWWLSAFPGLAIFLTVLLFNATGRQLRLALPG